MDITSGTGLVGSAGGVGDCERPSGEEGPGEGDRARKSAEALSGRGRGDVVGEEPPVAEGCGSGMAAGLVTPVGDDDAPEPGAASAAGVAGLLPPVIIATTPLKLMRC